MENTAPSRPNQLQRYLDAQAGTYEIALSEIKAGQKRSHWMWFIFPQLLGLGHSEYAHLYGIRNRNEAEAYLQHPVLGARLREICQALLQVKSSDALAIFGSPDNVKLRSCLTLFLSVPSNDHPLFEQLLQKFFGGEMDGRTIELLGDDLSAG